MARPYRILSLSGGGIRGIFQATYLQTIADDPDFEKPFCRNFDLIAGTSTGAIIGLAIALGIELAEIVRLYEDYGSAIFKRRRSFIPRFLQKCRYSPKPLQDVLENIFGRRMLGDCVTRHAQGVCGTPHELHVSIFSARLDETAHRRDPDPPHRRYGEHRSFSTIPRRRERQGRFRTTDRDRTAVEVALASCAAPTFFPAVQVKGSRAWYVDGGIWANNPSLFALIHAHSHLGRELSSVRILSLGTGRNRADFIASEYQNARLYKLLDKYLLDLWFLPQGSAADDFCHTLLGDDADDRFIEINPELRQNVALDDVEKALTQSVALDDVGQPLSLRDAAVQVAKATLPELKRKLRIGSHEGET